MEREEETTKHTKECNRSGSILRVVLFVVFPALIAGFIVGVSARKTVGLPGNEVIESDFNRDGKPDAKHVFSNGLTVYTECDRNFDGRPDYFEFYTNGIIARSEGDDNFDGRVDAWGVYTNGYILILSNDVDFNGVADVAHYYSNSTLIRSVWTPNGSMPAIREEFYLSGVKTSEVSVLESGVRIRKIFDCFEREQSIPNQK